MSATRLPNIRRDFAADPFLAHYFRLSRMYCGPSLVSLRVRPRRDPSAIERRVCEAGIRALVKLREIFRNEPKPGLIEVLAFTGKRWESGFAKFEERVAAIGSPMREFAMTTRQAA